MAGNRGMWDDVEMPDTTLMRFGRAIVRHEGVKGKKTPFQITGETQKQKDKMAGWNSMFDDTMKLMLDPKARPQASKFLYAKYAEDVLPGVIEQFRRYATRGMTVRQGVKTFDQTGWKDKIKFLEDLGFNMDIPIMDLFTEEGAHQPTTVGFRERL